MKDPLIGQRLGNYRIDSVVGRGGMATVYYGWDESLHRPAAVKVIDARYRDNPAYAERFLQEARAVATWRHDNILQVFYAGQQDDLYYFAMEYVDGLDLAQVMKQYVRAGELMPHEDVLKIGRAVAAALDYAHRQGIIHRDVKPSNVMVAKNGRVTLADFGLALNAQQGSFGGTFGSPHYIAPEQARNSAQAVPQSDLYALGVILYEMLTGAVPFDDPSPTTLALQHLTLPPPPPRQLNPRLSDTVEKTLLKALSKQPADRYHSGAALMDALTAALNTTPAAAPLQSSVALPVLSQMSVVDRVSLYMPPPPPGVPQSTPSVPESATLSNRSPAGPTQPRRRFRAGRLFVGGVVMVLLLIIGWALFGRDGSAAVAMLFTNSPPTATTAAILQPTETAVPQPAATDTAAPATATIEPVPVVLEQTPVAQPTEPSPPEPTVAAQPTEPSVPEPTALPPSETPAPPPTAVPDGLRLVMFYNSTSFYLYNPNPDPRVQVSQLVFESLDADGRLSGYQFDGVRWAQFYSFLNPMNCVRLEIPPTGWLRPSQCREYNSTVTPDEDGDLVFWTPQANVVAFRVVWQGEEVGRCDVNAGECEIFLP